VRLGSPLTMNDVATTRRLEDMLQRLDTCLALFDSVMGTEGHANGPRPEPVAVP